MTKRPRRGTSTALYYKAGGVPWRMTRHVQALTTCYVGVAFYRSADNETLQTSVAQVCNERGDGVIVRGTRATQSKDDRQPHLTGNDAKDLLEQSSARYRGEHRTAPARVMLHKTSFTPEELEGFRAAGEADRLDLLELVWIPRDDSARLLRQGEQTTLRVTLLSLMTSGTSSIPAGASRSTARTKGCTCLWHSPSAPLTSSQAQPRSRRSCSPSRR